MNHEGHISQSKKTPTIEQIESFWKSILGAASSYNKKAKWIDEYEVNYSTVEFEPITLDEITEATKKFWKWKRASVDSIQNLW